MKAIVYTRYGPPDVLQLQEVAKPVPANDEALIKLHAVSINRSDWEGLVGKPLYARIGGLRRPRRQILGSDIAGRVEAVGPKHKQFQPGDEVFGDVLDRLGGFAEYLCARGRVMVVKPASLTFEQASTIPQAGVIALQALRDRGKVQPGQKVLINGAGGGGTFAVQLAKYYGAEVTAVDHADKLPFLRSIGADHVIDYTRQDFTRAGMHFDMVLDLIALRSAFAYRRALRPHGSYFMVGGSMSTLFQVLFFGPWIARTTGKHVRLLVVQPNREDLVSITELCAEGKITPVIDRRFPLEQTSEALRYVGEGRSRGKVVITIS